MTGGNVPDTNALVKGTSGDESAVRRYGNRGDPILDSECQHAVRRLDVPESDCAVATTRRNRPAIAREVQAVDILLVARECVSDSASLDVPDTDQFVFGTSGKVLAIGAEADASDVQVAASVGVIVLQHADLVSRDDVIDLSRLIAPSRDVLAIHAEANTADNALVGQGVDQVHIEHAWNSRVEDDEPIIPCLLVLRGEALDIEVTKGVVGRMVRLGHPGVIRGRVGADLRRLARASRSRIRNWSVDLRSRGTTSWRPTGSTSLARPRAGGALGRLGRETARSWALGVLLLERGRLRWRWRRRRRALEPWRRLRHLVGRALLLLRRRRGRGDRTTLTTLAGHDGAEGIGAHADGRGRSLRRALMGRRADHGTLGSATSGLFELSAKMGDLFFKPARQDCQRVCAGATASSGEEPTSA